MIILSKQAEKELSLIMKWGKYIYSQIRKTKA